MLNNYVISHFYIDIICAARCLRVVRVMCVWRVTHERMRMFGGCLVAPDGRAGQLLDVASAWKRAKTCETLGSRL